MLDGACRLDKLVDRAVEMEFSALAITDHGVMHGVVDFYQNPNVGISSRSSAVKCT